jgi:hypothetical protein
MHAPPQLALLALLALSACMPVERPHDDGDLRTLVHLAYDEPLEQAALGLEQRYELDRPEIDLVPVPEGVGVRADVRMLMGPTDEPGAERVEIERVVGVFVPASSSLRLIDLSKGTRDVIIGRDGTPLGELSRLTLSERGLGDEINPRLLEADSDEVFDWIIERDAVGLAFVALAGERAADVRMVAQGARETGAIVATSRAGRDFIEWLQGGVTTRRPLRHEGFDLTIDPLAPKDPP